MRLGQIQKRQLVTEGWNDPAWTLFEQKEIHPWVTRIEQYVFEANLSPEQIKQLFTSVEQGSNAAGGNRTLAGKAVDVAKLPVEAVKWIDTQINKLGGLVQKAGPVKNADAKFEELKQKIGSKDSKVVNAVKAVSDWAKANPGKASVAVGILTAAAAVAGGPLGGAIAGFLARATKDLLQGQKLSTAVGKSIKTAAYGALAGAAIKGITDNIIDNIAIGSEAEADAMMDGFEKANFTAAVDKAVADSGLGTGVLDGAQNLEISGNINAFYYNYDLTMTADQVATYKQLASAASNAKAFSPEYYKAAGELHGWLSTTQQANADLTALARTIADIPRDALTGDQLDAVIAVLDNADEAIETIQGIGGAAGAAAQGAVQTVDSDAKDMHKAKPISPEQKAELEGEAGEEEENPNIVKGNESRIIKGKKLSEGQIYLLFNRLEKVNTHMLENKIMFESVFDALSHYNRQTINEGPLDALKKGAKAIGGAIKGAAKQVTTKVTAEKLNTAWKKAGSPTDSDEIYNVIKGMGVSDDVIKGTYDSMQIKPPAATDAPDADKDAGAADADTNADAPTDSTAGDAGSDTSTTGAADANAGGDEPAATDDAGATATASATDDDLGKAKEQRALRLGRGLSPQEEKQVEKEFTAAKELKKQGIEKGTEVTFKTSKGQQMKGTIVGPSEDGRETHLSIKDEKNKTYNFPKAGLMDKTGKPIAKPKAGSPDASPEDNLDKTGNPVGAPTDGATDTNTASTSGGQDDNATVDPQTGKSVAPDATSGETPAPDNRGAGQGQDTAATGTTAAPVDINKLAAELKKLGPDAVEDAKKLLAA